MEAYKKSQEDIDAEALIMKLPDDLTGKWNRDAFTVSERWDIIRYFNRLFAWGETPKDIESLFRMRMGEFL